MGRSSRRCIFSDNRGRGNRDAAPAPDANSVCVPVLESCNSLDDDYASAQHAQLFADESGTWMIEDLHSTNGTYVNEARIQAPTVVGAADVVRIGRTFIRLEK